MSVCVYGSCERMEVAGGSLLFLSGSKSKF